MSNVPYLMACLCQRYWSTLFLTIEHVCMLVDSPIGKCESPVPNAALAPFHMCTSSSQMVCVPWANFSANVQIHEMCAPLCQHTEAVHWTHSAWEKIPGCYWHTACTVNMMMMGWGITPCARNCKVHWTCAVHIINNI